MDIPQYIEIFKKAESDLDHKLLKKKQMESAVGIYGNSVFLKLFKKSWANPMEDALVAETRIFFSVWINVNAINEEKLWYNIHALKLRKLIRYKIESRKFAESFRKSFQPYEHHWPNLSVDFGPLTLMEGWQKSNKKNHQQKIIELANRFLEIEHLVEETLINFKVKK